MNRNLGLSAVGLALVASAFSLAPTPPQQSDVAKEVERLRLEVADLKRKSAGADMETLRTELKDAKAQLAPTVAYLNAQADAAATLVDALKDSEKKGFTFGINPDSRVVLLQGFQAYCEGLQKNVPGRAVVAAAPASAPPAGQ